MVLSELLAPAGSYDVLVIAVNAGADAVYIAGQQYGARAFAKNFTMEEIKKAVEYAHLNGVKVHVTVNTLINNFEIADVMNYLFKLYQIGIDAVIVQDFGICWLLKTLIPDLEVHGSTQMALSNYSSIKWAAKNNIKRVVLPREINVNQIAKTHEQLKKDNTWAESHKNSILPLTINLFYCHKIKSSAMPCKIHVKNLTIRK